jgi:hypothetical protein
LGTVWYKVDLTGHLFTLTPIADFTPAADEVSIYRVWFKSQMDAQKARVKAMSEQLSIPIPNLGLDPFDSRRYR